MRTLNAADTISGKSGRAYAKINGNNEELFFAKAISFKLTRGKSKVDSIGKTLSGHKATGGEITGAMTIYYVTPIFRDIMQEWSRTGKDVYFDLVMTNDDPDSAAGDQTILVKGVNLDEIVLAQLDASTEDALEEEVSCTAEGFEYLKPFDKI